MPETSSSPLDNHANETTLPSPSSVGNTFMRQYYHFLVKEPQSLHRFYKAESRWCHGFGSRMEKPIAGQRAINDQILKRGYEGARVDLDAGSIDCQNSLGGGVFVLVTGVMTLRSSPEPKPFVQTFFLAVQPKGYFVLNDCLRFLELSTLSSQDMEKNKSLVLEKDKKTETQTLTLPLEKLPIEKEGDQKEETFGNVSSEKAASPVKTTTTTSVTMVTKEDTPLSPVKDTATDASSPVKKTITTTTMTTTTTKKDEEENPAVVVKTPSPVKKQDEISAATLSPPVSVPANPAVSVPVEPEKPKTWAALFTVPNTDTTATLTTAATSIAVASSQPATTAAAVAHVPTPAPAVVLPTSGALAPEKSPKNKLSNGNEKEKEHKRLYSLFIRDLPPQTRENDLHELFKGYGSIAGVNVVLQRNFAFVDYYEQESMRAALAETKEFKVLNKVLQVTERGDRKESQRSGFRSNDSRGRGRGYGSKGGRGDRKERNVDDASFFNKGERREGFRREKYGNRRGEKGDGASRTE